MKIIFFVFVVLSVFFISCKKEKKPKEDFIYTGTASALKNNINWAAKVRFVNEQDSIYIEANVYNELNYLRQTLAFFKIPKKLGLFFLKKTTVFNNSPSTSFNTSQDDGDVNCDNFTLDTLRTDNFIKITNLDTIAKSVGCEFNGTYFINNIGGSKCNPNEVDTIKFKNGIIQGTF